MASHASTPRSRSRSQSSTGSSSSTDTTMNDAPPIVPVRPRHSSHGTNAASAPAPPLERVFPLLDLPRELRDRIYVYAMVSQFPFWWPAPSSPKHNVALGLLRTSRQVHQEATPVLYSHNKFLFTHPSDCNIFRVVASPFSENITSVYMRIREKDVKLWTAYLGSKQAERSMRADLPKLKSLWVFLRCAIGGTPGMIGQGGPVQGAAAHLPAGLAAQVHAVQQAVGGQMNALQQQFQNQINVLQQQVNGLIGQANALTHGPWSQQQHPAPPATPAPFDPLAAPPDPNIQPPPAPFHGQQSHPPSQPSPLAQQTAVGTPTAHGMHPQALAPSSHPHPFYTSFLRAEREIGLENLCLSLRETRPVEADVKVVCIWKATKGEVRRLLRVYPEELTADRNGDARTRFRRVHGVDVSFEVSGYEVTS